MIPRINLHMRAKFGCSQKVVSKKGEGTHTHARAHARTHARARAHTHTHTHTHTQGHCNFIIIIVDVFYHKLIGGHYCLLGWSLMSQNKWILAIFLTSECKLYLSKVEYFKVFSKKKTFTNTPPHQLPLV